MPDLLIELAHSADVETAVTLLRAQLVEHEIAVPEDALRDVVKAVTANTGHSFILLASMDAQPVGIAYAAAHLSAEHGGIVGWLEELYVVPASRSRGLGSALLDEVTKRARQLGWKALELEVVAGHERAVPLYLRHGFRALPRMRFSRILP